MQNKMNLPLTKTKNRITGRAWAASKPVQSNGLDEAGLMAVVRNLDSKMNVNLHAFDAATIGSPEAANGTLPFNLLNILPGVVREITKARKIDEVAGLSAVGSWEDEYIVQRNIEFSGDPSLYGDATNIPLVEYSPSYTTRRPVSYELGSSIGERELARAIRNGDNPQEYKRDAVLETLEIYRNLVGFFGFDNGGAGETFGLFNEPNLPAYVNVPADASGNVTWATKDFTGITEDIALFVSTLTLSSGGHISDDTPMTMVLPLSCNQYLSKRNAMGGLSVRMWIKETYPNLRIILVPEADGVNGGLNALYIFADKIDDSGTDSGSVIEQLVPAKLRALKIEVKAKITIEDYMMVTAGILVKRPYAIARFTGL